MSGDMATPKGSGCCGEAKGAGGDGGIGGGEGSGGIGCGLGTAAAGARSRFGVMAATTGGGVTNTACGMVTCTVEIDAGTTVIGGRAGADGAEAGGDGEVSWGECPPCGSIIFCSSVAIRALIKAMLCRVSSGLSMSSRWCRCSWNSGDFSPNVRRMHSRNCNSVLALAASR